MTLTRRRCNRCGGPVKAQSDAYGPYYECIQCGWHGYPVSEVKPLPDALVEAAHRPGRPPTSVNGTQSRQYDIDHIPKPDIRTWRWQRDIKGRGPSAGGTNKDDWHADITIEYSVEKYTRDSRRSCALCMNVEGWPYHRWGDLLSNSKGVKLVNAAFLAETGLRLRRLAEAVKESAPRWYS